MPERLTLDEKITGLASYWEKLAEVDPSQNIELEVPFLDSPLVATKHIQQVQESLRLQLGWHARWEYRSRGLNRRDLREDSDDRRRERSGLLAMTTAPDSPQTFFHRAHRIDKLLRAIVAGHEISRIDDQSLSSIVAVDTERALFAVFNCNDRAYRNLPVLYDDPVLYSAVEIVTRTALSLDLDEMFERQDAVKFESAA